jgi:hypothetical protein
MVVYRQKIKISSEASRYRRAGMLEVRAARMVRQAGIEARKQARVKTGRTCKEKRKSSTGKKHRLTYKHTITRTGETDQGVTFSLSAYMPPLFILQF